MPSDAPDSSPLAATRLRAGIEPVRRWIIGLGPVGRLLVLAALMTGLLAVGYYVGHPEQAGSVAFIYDGHHFTPDEASRIVRELESKAIAAHSVKGRIEVSRDRLSEAHAVLNKLGLPPITMSGIRDEPTSLGFMSTPAEREREILRNQEKLIETAIRNLDPRLSPLVLIRRTPAHGLAATGSVKISVLLNHEEGYTPSQELTERIKVVVKSLEPDLSIENGLSLCDSNGTAYLMPGSPGIGNRSHRQAREQELRSEIEQELDWIPGVRVGVSLEAEPEPEAMPLQTVPSTSPTAWVNAPPDEVPVPPESRGSLSPTPSQPASGAKVRVVVRVPSDYYLKSVHNLAGDRSPSPSELGEMEKRTRESITTAVELIVSSPDKVSDLKVERIPMGSGEPAAQPPSLEVRPITLGWPIVCGIGLACGVLVLTGIGRWWLSRQTPRGRVMSAPHRPRPDVAGLAPAERAREFVRLDPAAAAGVLQSWISSGGSNP